MKTTYTLYAILLALIFSSCSEFNAIVQQLPEAEKPILAPSSSEMAQGLKAALEKGTLSGVADLEKSGGYLTNDAYKIYFPPSVQKVETKLRALGLDQEIDRLVVSLNSAAENAVVEAKPLFINAIKQMTFDDAKEILFGTDTAATSYLKDKTAKELRMKFQPQIQQSLDQVNATKYWTEIISRYNQIPFVEKVETDLSKYVTARAVSGLFLKVAEKEKAIRQNPQERSTELLRKVFDYANK